jgi:hypothetical protein
LDENAPFITGHPAARVQPRNLQPIITSVIAFLDPNVHIIADRDIRYAIEEREFEKDYRNKTPGSPGSIENCSSSEIPLENYGLS